MKCFDYCKNKNKKCKSSDCRYWIENGQSFNCTLIAAAQKENITLEDIGKIFNVTRMRICQIEKRAIEKLKSMILS